MSFGDMFYRVMVRIRPFVQAEPGDRKSVLGVGAQDFAVSERLFRKLPIDGIDRREITHLYSQYDPVKFSDSSKALLTRLFASFGYAEYKDLDIYSRADIVIDLNADVPDELKEKFDLVLDVTSNYVSDVRKSYQNTSEMCKVGGCKLIVAMIGDQTNRFDLNPSPNYILDMHLNSGFVLEWSGMIDNAGKVLPYTRIASKASKLPMLLPPADFLRTWARQLAWAMLYDWPKLSKQTHVPVETPPAAPASTASPAPAPPPPAAPMGLKSRLVAWTKSRISPAQLERFRQWRTLRARRRNHWIVQRIGDQWAVFFLLRKVKATTVVPLEITPHYRAFDETRARTAAQ